MGVGTWLAAAGAIGIVASVIVSIMSYLACLRTGKAILGATGLACVLGAVVGLLPVYIAVEHNPQGEFINHETGAVNYADLSVLFLSGFALSSLGAGLLLAAAVWATRGLILYRAIVP
jgi:hypothetical protein